MGKKAGLFLIALFFLFSPGIILCNHWGLKVGGALSFGGKTSIFYDSSNRLAGKAGLYLDFPIGGGFSIQPELSYSMKGFGYYDLQKRSGRIAALNYIEVPVLLRMNGLKRVGIALGPYIGFLTKTPTLDNAWTSVDEVKVRNIDAGISASLNFRFTNDFIELQFCQGFADVVYGHNSDYESSSRKPFRNSTLSLLLGIIF